MHEAGLAVADRLFTAIEAGDIDTVHDLYAADVEIWHNCDGVVQSRDDNIRVLRWMTKHLSSIRYEAVRRSATADGFVQQHVLRAIKADGSPIEVPSCIVCTTVEGRIIRLDEYLDSSHIAPLLRP